MMSRQIQQLSQWGRLLQPNLQNFQANQAIILATRETNTSISSDRKLTRHRTSSATSISREAEWISQMKLSKYNYTLN